MSIANTAQAEHWNSGEGAAHWIDSQARYDRRHDARGPHDSSRRAGRPACMARYRSPDVHQFPFLRADRLRRGSRAELERKARIGAPFDQAAVVYSHMGVAEPYEDVGEAGRCRARSAVGDDLSGFEC